MRGILMLLSLTGLPRLLTRLMLDRRVPLGLKLLLPAALVYLISPIDVVRDAVPALGRIDDILVILISVGIFLGMAPKDVVSEHLRSGSKGSGSGQPEQPVIDGEYRIVDDDKPGS